MKTSIKDQLEKENRDLVSLGGRLALELECLLLDTKDLAVASKWWDTAHDALGEWHEFMWDITHGSDSANGSTDSADTFCKSETAANDVANSAWRKRLIDPGY